MKANPFINMREQMNQLTLQINEKSTIDIEFRGLWLVFIGLRVIELGCWICGIRFEESQ